MDVVPDWDAYFLLVAEAVAKRSKDPFTKVGALLVDSKNHIVVTGYNGFAAGDLETADLWQRPEKYLHVIHAEENVINYAKFEGVLAPLTLYCTLCPCKKCIDKILKYPQIKKIVYVRKYTDSDEVEKTASGKIELVQLRV